MDTWNPVWLFWLGLFLVFELTAVLLHKPTLSQKTWDWFSLRARKRWWIARRVVFLVFWLSLGIGHFLLGGPALWTVILPGIPFGAVIVYAAFFESNERAGPAAKGGIVGWLKKVWGGLKSAGTWVVRHGPVFSSAILGVSFAFPALKPLAVAFGAIVSGGAAPDSELVKLIGELILGAISLIGVTRKVWSRIK